VRERGGVQIFERFASGSPPSFVQVDKARRIREREMKHSQLGCLLGRVGEGKRKKEKKRMRFDEFGQNSIEF
jgi:hypothetical protein